MHIGHEDAFLWSVVKLESTEKVLIHCLAGKKWAGHSAAMTNRVRQ